MTVVWPSELPCSVILGSLQASPRGRRLSTAPEVGSPKMRRRGPQLRQVPCVMKVSANQRARFDRFWEEDTEGGVAPFLFRDQLVDGCRIKDEAGTQIEDEGGIPLVIESWWLVQFAQQDPVYQRVSGSVFQIQFDLVVLP